MADRTDVLGHSDCLRLALVRDCLGGAGVSIFYAPISHPSLGLRSFAGAAAFDQQIAKSLFDEVDNLLFGLAWPSGTLRFDFAPKFVIHADRLVAFAHKLSAGLFSDQCQHLVATGLPATKYDNTGSLSKANYFVKEKRLAIANFFNLLFTPPMPSSSDTKKPGQCSNTNRAHTASTLESCHV